MSAMVPGLIPFSEISSTWTPSCFKFRVILATVGLRRNPATIFPQWEDELDSDVTWYPGALL